MINKQTCRCFALAFFLFQIYFNPVSAQGSLSFDGTDDYATLPTGLCSSLNGSFTLEAWVYWRGGTNMAWQRIFDFGTGTTVNMFLTTSPGNNAPRFAITTGGTGGEQQVSSATVLTLNAWHHLAVVLVDATNTATLYVDGNPSASNSGMTLRPSALGATDRNYLGRSQYPADPYFYGYMDEMRISSSARYTSAFVPVRTGFTQDASTVALYHMNESTGQTISDATGNWTGLLGATASVESFDPSWTTLTTLPVKITDFQAYNQNAVVNVLWRAAAINGNNGFFVERSSNQSLFTPVAFVPAGNAVLNQYTYTDANLPAGTWYYRLRQQDQEGKNIYSGVIRVTVGTVKGKPTWTVLGKGVVELRMSNGSDESYRLTDMSGHQLQGGRMINGKAVISSLPGGIYNVLIREKTGETVSVVIRM